jgi:hypothetical protein
MIRAGLHFKLRPRPTLAQASLQLRANIMKAGIGSAVLPFT